jgi:hypothetical protein
VNYRTRPPRWRTFLTRAAVLVAAIALLVLLGWIAGQATPVPTLDLDQPEPSPSASARRSDD